MPRGPLKSVVERRRRVIDSLLSVLTDPATEFTTEDLEGFVMRAFAFGIPQKLDAILEMHNDLPELRSELTIGAILYLVNKTLKTSEAQ
jgi:hypothetical protein